MRTEAFDQGSDNPGRSVHNLVGWLNKGHVSPPPPLDSVSHVGDVNVTVKQSVHRPWSLITVSMLAVV